MNTARTRQMTTLAVLSAIAYLVMVVGRVPVVLFLKYDPKDVVITIAGFIFGPLSAMIISVVVSFIEMVTVSSDGPIGLLMNVLASCAFACTASYIYKKKKSISGAIIGLVAGCIAMTGIMLLWNYFVAPFYMGVPREQVAALLIPAFLPFNVIKSVLNAAITMLLYKPVVSALRRSSLIPQSETPQSGKFNVGIIAVSLVVLLSCVIFVLILQGVL